MTCPQFVLVYAVLCHKAREIWLSSYWRVCDNQSVFEQYFKHYWESSFTISVGYAGGDWIAVDTVRGHLLMFHSKFAYASELIGRTQLQGSTVRPLHECPLQPRLWTAYCEIVVCRWWGSGWMCEPITWGFRVVENTLQVKRSLIEVPSSRAL